MSKSNVDGSFVTSSNNMGGGTVSCCMAIYEVWGISWVVERVISQVNFIYFTYWLFVLCLAPTSLAFTRQKVYTVVQSPKT